MNGNAADGDEFTPWTTGTLGDFFVRLGDINSAVAFKRGRILMEHIDYNCSLESKLLFSSNFVLEFKPGQKLQRNKEAKVKKNEQTNKY